MFRYSTEGDQEKPCDVVFSSLAKCHYGSCILDLLHFLFSCVKQLINNVYFEAFNNAVTSINKKVEKFDKLDFDAEVRNLAVFCGFLTLEMEFKTVKAGRRKSVHDINQEMVLATFRDVLKLIDTKWF